MRKAILLGLATFFSALPAFAQAAVGNEGYYALGAAIAIGVAAFGCGMGQGRVGASAMDGIARNPQAQKSMFVPMIIALALIESIAIYGFVIAFMLSGNIGA